MSCNHVNVKMPQVLVWAAPHVHLGALEATLRHLTGATLPPGCTRAIYVVDAYRSAVRLSQGMLTSTWTLVS